MINKEQIDESFRRKQLEEDMNLQDNNSIKERIDRYLEIERPKIIGGQYFAKSSTECFDLYRDGYFIGAVMMSHAINEGIIKFVAKRNKIEFDENKINIIKYKELLKNFLENKIISRECNEASKSILDSDRNSIHHMNPKVEEIDFPESARKNLKNLIRIEKEIFGHSYGKDGSVILNKPKYWDFNEAGMAKVFVDFE